MTMSESTPLEPYAILGVAPDATNAEIAHAYRRLLRAHHPDTSSHPGEPACLSTLMAAYHVLRDPTRRADYDRRRRHREHVERSAPVAPQRRQPNPLIRAGPVRWHPS